MRLTDQEIKAIKNSIHYFDNKAKIYLFGSRIHMDKKGGDIDLLLLSQSLSQKDVYRIKTRLWDEIGEQQIDIILAKDYSKPFTRMILKEGVEIC